MIRSSATCSCSHAVREWSGLSRQGADDTGGAAACEHPRWQVAGDDRPGAYDGVGADRHATGDDHAGGQPDVAPDRDGFGGLPPIPTPGGLEGMQWREELDVRPDLDVVTDGDPRDVGKLAP